MSSELLKAIEECHGKMTSWGGIPKAIMVHSKMIDDFLAAFPQGAEISGLAIPVVADDRIPYFKSSNGIIHTEIWLGDPDDMPPSIMYFHEDDNENR